jgi:hypothetical protein
MTQLFAEPLFNKFCSLVACFAVVAYERIYMPHYLHVRTYLLTSILYWSSFGYMQNMLLS